MYFYYTEPKLSPRSHLESCNLDNIPHILSIPFRTSRSHLLFLLFFLKLHILTEIHLAHCFALFVFKNKKRTWWFFFSQITEPTITHITHRHTAHPTRIFLFFFSKRRKQKQN